MHFPLIFHRLPKVDGLSVFVQVYDQDGIVIKKAKVEKLPEYNQAEVSWRLN